MDGDLISRSALLKDFAERQLQDCSGSGFVDCFMNNAQEVCTEWWCVEDAVENAPSVDAVTVVRCKDCKRWGIGIAIETERVKVCEFGRYMVAENGYCVYGEKKEG